MGDTRRMDDEDRIDETVSEALRALADAQLLMWSGVDLSRVK